MIIDSSAVIAIPLDDPKAAAVRRLTAAPSQLEPSTVTTRVAVLTYGKGTSPLSRLDCPHGMASARAGQPGALLLFKAHDLTHTDTTAALN